MSAQDIFFDGKLLVEASLGRGSGTRGMGGPSGGSGSTIHESNMPPIALRLRLTNKSQENVEVIFVLCKSALGDFAVRPGKLALAPEQATEPDSMISRLGAPSDELLLQVSLRMAGKTEQKTLVLLRTPPTEPSTASKL